MKIRSDVVTFHGHPLIQARHSTTFEITRDETITRRGDCIIGVRANKACMDLDPVLKGLLQRDQTIVKLKVVINNMAYQILGKGDKRLSLTSTREIVARISSFASDRTIAVKCDRAASDLPRSIIQALKNPEAVGRLIISV